MNRLERVAVLDRALAEAAGPINVLKHLRWPAQLADSFLAGWRAGRPALPDVTLAPPDMHGRIAALEAVARDCDDADPLQAFIRRTAESYATAARMLEGIGRPEFTQHSTALYAGPESRWKATEFTAVDVANILIGKTDLLLGSYAVAPTVADIPAPQFAERLRSAMRSFFTDDDVEVVLDDSLASKAIAGATRIRIRASAMFSELDLGQLLHHEAYVHTATVLNGRRQPHLKALGLGAPRTTRTQEGIAVIAEALTLSMDITRLRRLAIRVLGLKAALDGGDFMDVFRLFLDSGQTEEESYQSAQRIFRGGDVRGGVAFTKDCAYLRGLIEVDAFIKIAIRENRPELVKRLFAGRLTTGDVILLEPEFESGLLAEPRYVAPWAAEARCLAAVLAYAGFMNSLDLGVVTLDRFWEYEVEQLAGEL